LKPLTYKPIIDAARKFLPWVTALGKQSGAYIIRSRPGGRTLYVGESHTGNLAKTLKRHFWTWGDTPERKHHTYDPRKVEVAVRITPQKSATTAQDNLILRLKPRDNLTNPAAEPEPF